MKGKKKIEDITEHKQGEEALRASEERFRTSVENMLDCFGLYSAIRDESGHIVDFRVDYVNEAACVNNLLTREEQIGKGLCELLPAHRESGLFDEYCKLVETGKPLMKESLSYEDAYEGRHLVRTFDIRAVKLADGFAAAWRDVTERRQAEAALKASEERFRQMFDNMNSGVAVYEAAANGADFIFKDFNNAAERIEGVARQDLIGKSVVEVFPGVKEFGLFDVFQRVWRTGKSEYHPISLYKDQRIAGWRENFVYKLPSGEIVAIYDDVTRIKQAEESVQEAALRLKMAIHAANVGLWDWDLLTNKVYYSPEWKQQIGYEDWEITDNFSEWESRVHPDDLDRSFQTVRAFIEKPWPDYHLEFRFRHKDGSYRWILAQASLFHNEDGKPIRMLGSHIDITERKLAEDALRESKGWFSTAFHCSPVAMTIASLPEGCCVDVNESFLRMMEYTREEVIGHTSAELNMYANPDDRAQMSRIFSEEGRVNNYEFTVRTKTGKLLTVLTSSEKLWFRGQDHVISATINVTERKQAEEALRKSEMFNRSLVEHLPQLIFIKDRNLVYLSCNANYAHSLGIKLEEIVGKDDFAFYPRELAEKYRTDDRTVINTGKLMDIEEKYQVAGEERWVHTIKVPYRDEQGSIVGVLGIFQNITEHVRTEEALKESEQLYRQLLEVAPVGIAVHSKGKLVFTNPAGARMLGANSVQDLIGKPIREIVHPEGWKAAKDRIQRMLKGGQGLYPVEDRYIRLDGTAFPVEVMTIPIQYQGKPSVQVIALDITERKQVEEERRQNAQKLIKAMESTIEAMATTVEMRDPYTAGHQQRVTVLASAIAREIDLSGDQVYGISLAGIVHDIGKIYVPAEILSKPGRLSEIELNLIKMHPQVGYNILKDIQFPWPIARTILQHHERMDGSGYPAGLSEEAILLEARILAVADVVEAMASHRPYRAAIGLDGALEEISRNSGILYDADVVDACIRLFHEKGFKFE